MDKSEVVESVAKKRAKICSGCEHIRHGKILAFIKDDLKEIEGCYCNICKCPSSALLRSTKPCELNKW